MCEASVTGPAASVGLPAAVCTSALIECRRLANCSHIAWLVELLGWSRLETGPRYQQNCTECHKEKARPIRSEPQESQAAPWRLQSIASGPGGIPATKRSPPNSGAYHVQESANNEERAKSHQEHSRLSICRCPAQYNRAQASRLENVPARRCNSARRMGRAQRNPSLQSRLMGFASLYPSYGLKTAAAPAPPSGVRETPRRRRSAAGRRAPFCLPAPPPCRAS
jgi:hypothetical protein